MSKLSNVFTMTIVLAAPPAIAAPQQDAPATALIDSLAACLEIGDDARRLACTDAAARKLVDASRRREVVVVDKAEVTRTKRSLFGFSLPRIGLFGSNTPAGADKEEIDELEAPITRVVGLGSGRYGITIEGGARWNTTEPWVRGVTPTAGASLKIKRAALGSYFVKIGSGRAVRAMRIG
ncbi:hypothetical protein [Sphingomonas guangdongensis]|uniref:hypothetical protein n=1 Tax=Sphingomonas guangdongensis TaxID=1141890 RepID=UPI0011818F70|nr:hypothetical protein [Sphingomonas guangdongensis]